MDLDRLPSFRGVVFDLWNTLAHDTARPNPVLALMRALGVDRRPGWRRTLAEAIMRRRFDGIDEALPAIEAAFALPPRDEARGAARRAWAGAERSAALFPDVLPTLEALRLRGYRLALLSNTQSFGLSLLERSGLTGRLDAVHLSCDTGRLKPEAEAFLGVAGELGLAPAEALMVGDHLTEDVLGARSAGLGAVLIRREAPGLSHREELAREPWVSGLDVLARRLGPAAGR
jgi:putative hydrolase of the HAD superfamily